MGCFAIQREQGEESKGNGRGARILGWTFRFVSSRRSKPPPNSSETSGSSSTDVAPKMQDLKEFTLGELKSATKNFSMEKLGEGGFGAVYKGVIKERDRDEKTPVAVKKLNVKGQQGQKEWLSEVTFLRMVDHPNLVKLLGYCLDDDERGPQCLLVYEFMPNKGLDSHLFSKDGVLSWEKRLQIALGTARGLAYLHDANIIYRDLKAGNILLDAELNPKLSDFGLARGGPDMGATHVTTAPVGTPGYAAPEYVQTGRLTPKSDVWSFGMVLLELVTGKKALDLNRPRSERSLAEWVKNFANDSKKFRKVVDPKIKTQETIEQARGLVLLALKCSNKVPKARPRMREVVTQLEQMIISGGAEDPSEKNSLAPITDVSATGSDLIAANDLSHEISGPETGFGIEVLKSASGSGLIAEEVSVPDSEALKSGSQVIASNDSSQEVSSLHNGSGNEALKSGNDLKDSSQEEVSGPHNGLESEALKSDEVSGPETSLDSEALKSEEVSDKVSGPDISLGGEALKSEEVSGPETSLGREALKSPEVLDKASGPDISLGGEALKSEEVSGPETSFDREALKHEEVSGPDISEALKSAEVSGSDLVLESETLESDTGKKQEFVD